MDSDLTKKDETITDNNQDPSSAGSAPPAAIHGKTKAPAWVSERSRTTVQKLEECIECLKRLPKEPSSGGGELEKAVKRLEECIEYLKQLLKDPSSGRRELKKAAKELKKCKWDLKHLPKDPSSGGGGLKAAIQKLKECIGDLKHLPKDPSSGGGGVVDWIKTVLKKVRGRSQDDPPEDLSSTSGSGRG